MTIHDKPLRPSSQRRLSRWARALRNRRVQAFHWLIIGDERLRLSISRRLDAEWKRGNLPGDMIEIIERELGRGVEYRLAELACARIEKTDAYRERRQALEEVHWRDIHNKAWSQSLISLTDAAYWIATSGEPREPEDDDLERAARELVAKLQSGELVAHGLTDDAWSHAAIPIEHILTATRDGAPIFGESVFGGAPRLLWAIIPGKDGDTIEDRNDAHWRSISVRKADLQAMWPGQDADVEERTQTISGADNPAEDPLAPYRTGAPGRPSPIQFVEEEAERRRKIGEANLILGTEADYLHEWCKKTHPTIVAPKAKTIENRIRAAHRNWNTSK